MFHQKIKIIINFFNKIIKINRIKQINELSKKLLSLKILKLQFLKRIKFRLKHWLRLSFI